MTYVLVEAVKNTRNVAENRMDLETTAKKIIKDLDLLHILSAAGEAHLVGNIALGTTVRPDIDFVIYADESVWRKNAEAIIESLKKKGYSDFNIRELKESKKLLISYNIDYEQTMWDLHITFTLKGGDYLTDSYQFYLDYKDKMTPEKLKTIIKLKKYFLKKKMLWNGMSFFIYKSVIDENAQNVSDIFEYLSNNKINISRFKK